MKYISGKQALNIPCSLNTCGDHHIYVTLWDKLNMLESDDSIFKDYGIEKCNSVSNYPGEYYVANTLRALLDLLAEGEFIYTQEIREKFIGNEEYTQEFMEKVLLLKDSKYWNEIDMFMGMEYTIDWLEFKEANNIAYKKMSIENDIKYTEIEDINKRLLYAITRYLERGTIEDAYMLVNILKNHKDKIEKSLILQVTYALEYCGMDYIYYIAKTQQNEHVDNDKLIADFLVLHKLLGLYIEDRG